MAARPPATGAEEGAPERATPSEREAARGGAQPEPEPEFCGEWLAEPEPDVEEGFAVSEFRSQKKSLEDVFMNVTTGAVQ